MITKVGIRISLYDEHDCELASVGDWIDCSAHQHIYRTIYDDMCAAAWTMLLEAFEQAANHNEPSTDICEADYHNG